MGVSNIKEKPDVTPFKTNPWMWSPPNRSRWSKAVMHGWAHFVRDKNQVVFIVLRDRSGLMQVTVDESCDPSVLEIAKKFVWNTHWKSKVRFDFVRLPTKPWKQAKLSCWLLKSQFFSKTEPLPFGIAETDPTKLPSEEIRLKYRYLDLRRDNLQSAMRIRHQSCIGNT